jgi:hypothetical protein
MNEVEITCELSRDEAADRRIALVLEKSAFCFIKMEPPEGRSAWAEIRVNGDDELARQVAATLRNSDLVLGPAGSISLVLKKPRPAPVSLEPGLD